MKCLKTAEKQSKIFHNKKYTEHSRPKDGKIKGAGSSRAEMRRNVRFKVCQRKSGDCKAEH